MFLKYVDYNLSPGGAKVYQSLNIDKKCYFDDIKFDTVEQMECLLHTLKMIKEKDNLNLVIQYLEDIIEVRNCGVRVETEYHKKQMENNQKEIQLISKVNRYIIDRKKRCEKNIMLLKDNEATDDTIRKVIKECNEDIKKYVIAHLGEEEYQRRLKNVTNE